MLHMVSVRNCEQHTIIRTWGIIKIWPWIQYRCHRMQDILHWFWHQHGHGQKNNDCTLLPIFFLQCSLKSKD